ncbi:uncharacterized protein AB675_7252 [Cyphellophora attinorum]|uniref:Uncharacterized protein n=1 Tax=Cyphellophora attinorum TaxID=1664694 RepID=A0A0N0NJ05_9EURO|nr:uncharacterized protein AB675_7252 [Phialophora attinorum]KPI36358.1 hypothetical protein AB675_7252 [Phialophora attinorum]
MTPEERKAAFGLHVKIDIKPVEADLTPGTSELREEDLVPLHHPPGGMTPEEREAAFGLHRTHETKPVKFNRIAGPSELREEDLVPFPRRRFPAAEFKHGPKTYQPIDPDKVVNDLLDTPEEASAAGYWWANGKAWYTRQGAVNSATASSSQRPVQVLSPKHHGTDYTSRNKLREDEEYEHVGRGVKDASSKLNGDKTSEDEDDEDWDYIQRKDTFPLDKKGDWILVKDDMLM